MTKIVDKMTKDLDLSVYHDGYKERIEALVTFKMKGEVAQVEEKLPKKPAAKSMMEAMRATAESLSNLFFAGIKDALLGILGLKRTLSPRLSPAPRSRCA